MESKNIITKHNIKNFTLIVLGCFISSIGANMFIINAKLFSGGLSGIAILFQYLVHIPAGYTILVLNIPLLLLSYRELNIRFTIFSLVGTLALSVFLIVTKNMSNILTVHDTIFYCVYGGALMGAGHGIAYANHGSEGGMDIVVMLVKKKYDNFDVGQLGFIVNCVIVALGAILNGMTVALYTLISMYISAYVTDKLIHGLSKKKVLFVITDKYNEVCKYIEEQKYHGAALLEGYKVSGKERKVLYCVIHVSALPEFKFQIQKIDKEVMISVIDASEVDGKGFDSNIL